ncbi:MAG: hypothetical protein FWH56_03595, partial [Betaproteobacteria bacterium]|nr:hypothetical protein [Betaproteobacteria bacterium]
NALIQPQTKHSMDGEFEGEVREADLDKTRFQLRTKDGVIRCVKPKMQTDEARKIFGRRIRARGKYETNREGKPRLLLVESIESMPETGRLEL